LTRLTGLQNGLTGFLLKILFYYPVNPVGRFYDGGDND